ncbi:MAG TPA: sigma 54-interacting transcriptional regulator [Candidatus Limnocylindrales bacterium]|nr:sigma 54-interacting transcriptional regulator [Candidatus Limnocylindrales bacterium]
MSVLMRIQSVVQDVAEAIAAALSVEVEIVDDELTVVAGSNRYRDRIGQKEEFGQTDSDFLYARTLRTGKSFVVSDPVSDPRYDPSSLDGTTPELGEICSPIKMGEDVIGVIGLAAFTADQYQQLLGKTEAKLLFLKHMGRLLAAKLYESEAVESLTLLSRELSTILETIHEGALAINAKGQVTHCNTTAAKLLKLERSAILGRNLEDFWKDAPALKVLATGNEYIEKEEIYQTKNKQMHFIVSVRAIAGVERPVGAVVSFRDISEARRLIYNLSSTDMEYTFDDIIGQSKIIKQIKEQALRVAGGNSTVLITGESGTGKEIFARAIHRASMRGGGPFISVNCGAIPETLLESELFGYDGGAFTGARKEGKAGKFELADGGTIFLDEIGEMPLHLQVKLLHVLQNREVERVGGSKKIPVNVRIIAASNRELEVMMQEGNFRKDLYFRLSVIPMHIPPLKERREDIPALVDRCIIKYGLLLKKRFEYIDPEAMECLMQYNWPGNVRELENALEYAVNMTNGSTLDLSSLPPRIREALREDAFNDDAPLKERIKNYERKLMQEYLDRFGHTVECKNLIAEKLEISRATLYRRLAELSLGKKKPTSDKDAIDMSQY